MKSPMVPVSGASKRRVLRAALAVVSFSVSVAVLAGCASATQSTSTGAASFTKATQNDKSTITVWTDSTRLPAVQAYQKSHPNVKMNIVTFDGSADGSTYLQTKIQLFDRTGKGWPDVVFASPTDVTWASKPTTPSAQAFAAPMDELVPQSTLDNFAKGSLTPCEYDGHTYCLRNDIAQVVTWYNKTLFDQFGYTVPTTWEQYEALSVKVAKDHPGYVLGWVGDSNSQESYFWSSQCPAFDLIKPNTLLTNLQSPDCTRMSSLLDTMIANKTISTQASNNADFIKNVAPKVLMAVGPSWYGQYIFNGGFKTPAGQIAAANPMTWDGDSTAATGNVGGAVWMVSSHSKNLKAATAVSTWLTTSNANQGSAPTYPAYKPAAKVWLANPTNSKYFASDVSGAFTTAANEVWTGWSNTKFSDSTAWSSVVLPALTAGKTLTETLPAWQAAIVDEAKSVGYTVTTK